MNVAFDPWIPVMTALSPAGPPTGSSPRALAGGWTMLLWRGRTRLSAGAAARAQGVPRPVFAAGAAATRRSSSVRVA